MPGQAMPGQARSCQAKPDETRPDQTRPTDRHTDRRTDVHTYLLYLQSQAWYVDTFGKTTSLCHVHIDVDTWWYMHIDYIDCVVHSMYSVFSIQDSVFHVSIHLCNVSIFTLDARTHIYIYIYNCDNCEPNLPVLLREGSRLPLTQARCAQSFEREKQRTQAQLGSTQLHTIDSKNDSQTQNNFVNDFSSLNVNFAAALLRALRPRSWSRPGSWPWAWPSPQRYARTFWTCQLCDLWSAKNSERSNQV